MNEMMTKTKVLVVVNGGYGTELLAAAEVLVGDLEVTVLETPCMAGPEELRSRLRAGIEAFAVEQREVLMITDLCGSTQANICLEYLAHNRRWEMLTGLNLAMLMKLATCDRTCGARDLARRLRRTGEESIKLGSPLLPEEGARGN